MPTAAKWAIAIGAALVAAYFVLAGRSEAATAVATTAATAAQSRLGIATDRARGLYPHGDLSGVVLDSAGTGFYWFPHISLLVNPDTGAYFTKG